MLNWLEEATENLTKGDKNKLGKEETTDLFKRYFRIFSNIKKRGLPLSKLEIHQFEREFLRLGDLHQLYRRAYRGVTGVLKVESKYIRLKYSVINIDAYSAEAHDKFKLDLSVSFNFILRKVFI